MMSSERYGHIIKHLEVAHLSGYRHGAAAAAAAAGRADRRNVAGQETYRTGELIQRLSADGMTVVVVEHEMAFIWQISKRVTVLHLGQVFAQDGVESIIADPRVAPSEGVQPSIVQLICGALKSIRDELGSTILLVEQTWIPSWR